MKKNGFTLVELLAVIALIAILSGIAIPNVMSSIDNSQKNAFLTDAKRMVSKAQYLLSKDLERNAITEKVYGYDKLNEKGEFASDADGGNFIEDKTYVKVVKEDDTYKYCIAVVGSKRKIVAENGECIFSDNLNIQSVK